MINSIIVTSTVVNNHSNKKYLNSSISKSPDNIIVNVHSRRLRYLGANPSQGTATYLTLMKGGINK